MPVATNQQMQAFADQRIRPRAEQFRALVNSLRDDKASIDDEYARAISASAWADTRNDPPHLLQSGNSANPDDLLNYNALVSALLTIIDGTSNIDDAANAAMATRLSIWPHTFAPTAMTPIPGLANDAAHAWLTVQRR
jgi:hypothetical protein